MPNSPDGWIGVDFDGTLAKWSHGVELGAPVEAMVERVKAWLEQGADVRIFTARADSPEYVGPIREWCRKHIGRELIITNVKDYACRAIYDDIAYRVMWNQGVLL